MNSNFSHYSPYYDLLYSDKDYRAEVSYINDLIDEYSTIKPRKLLEMGCGTGIHAGLIASQGMDVHGIDLSQDMLDLARARADMLGFDSSRLAFHQGDVCNYRTPQTFDVVTSLFHVLSYQNTEDNLQAMFRTANVHLEPDGLFIFDFWYGPAVLWQKPAVRAKKFANDNLEITRVAEPVVRELDNVVDVNYTIFVNDKREITEIKERHSMRYLFMPEINRLINENGFECVHAEEWLTRNKPSFDSWGVCVIARKKY